MHCLQRDAYQSQEWGREACTAGAAGVPAGVPPPGSRWGGRTGRWAAGVL